MKKLLFVVVVGILSTFGAFGQQYNGPALFDASGAVKSIKVSPTPIFSAGKVEFMKDGHIVDSTLTFDWDGKAIGKQVQIYKMRQNVNLGYDEAGRLTEALVESSSGLPGGYNAAISYSEEHPSRMIVTETKGKNPLEYTYIYSDYAFDPAGNWISRDVTLSVKDLKKNENKKTEKYTETRKIEYYK